MRKMKADQTEAAVRRDSKEPAEEEYGESE